MYKNYLKISVRNLLRHRAFSLINICGLAVGLACCILIFLYVQSELSFDRYHHQAGRVYRILNERFGQTGVSKRAFTPPAMGPAMKTEFPEVLECARLYMLGKILISQGDQRVFEENAFIADPTIFDILGLTLEHGNAPTALNQPNTIIISELMATKYFGEANPVGRILDIDNGDRFTITGVFANLPEESHLRMEFIASFATMKQIVSDPKRLESWVWQQFYTYIVLPANYQPELLEAKFPEFVKKYAYYEISAHGFTYMPYLQPLEDIYLRSAGLEWDLSGPRGNITYVYAFSIIALFILMIACCNFMNLSTARSLARAKEVGIRKVAGARRHQLIQQFLGESFIISAIALVLAVFFAEFAMPYFKAFVGRELRLEAYMGPVSGIALLAMVVLLALLAGSYPAMFLSRFIPVKVLKAQRATDRYTDSGNIRRWLVIAQFTISVFLIILTAVVQDQIVFLRHKNLGFNREHILTLPLRGDMQRNYERLKSHLLQNPAITNVSASYGGMSSFVAGDDIRLPGHENTWPTSVLLVEHDFIRTYGMEIIAGRDFSQDLATDEQEAFILNETAVQKLGWIVEAAIGKEIWWDEWSGDGIKKGEVIGVVRDFHFASLRENIEPIVMHIYPAAFSSISVRVRPENIRQTIAFLEKTWQQYAPAWPFEYRFLDRSLDAKYKSEIKLMQLLSGFSFLAIAVACLGLFGLSSYTIEQRIREVGIRKVLGASVTSIVTLFSKDLAKLVLVAFLISTPLAYYAATIWLQDFAYRVELQPGLFAASGMLAMGIALFTIALQAFKAATSNPVSCLRDE